MSEVVDRFPPAAYAKYDWERWIDGQIHKCTQGVDFETAPSKFVRAAYKWASDHGMTARGRVLGDSVWLQFAESKVKRRAGRPKGVRLLRAS